LPCSSTSRPRQTTLRYGARSLSSVETAISE
jgi:hypothetical protein